MTMLYVDNPQLLSLKYSNGLLLLPYYHTGIMAKLNGQHFSGESRERQGSGMRVLKLLRGLNNISFRKSKIIGFSNTRWEIKTDGKWRNIQHGYYYDIFPDQFLLIEGWNEKDEWKTHDSYPNLSFIETYITALSHLAATIFNKIHVIKRKDFERLHELYPFISLKRISYDDYFIRAYSVLIKVLFRLAKPNVIMIHCGSYGGPNGIICKIAKEMGIKSIDTQHGQIFFHKAYSASDVVRNCKEYKQYLPDYFYSFGDYWSSCVDWKYEKVSVGNPYLNENITKFKNVSRNIDYLFISQPYSKDLQIDFVKTFSKIMPKSKIVYRLHPTEAKQDYVGIFKGYSNVELSDGSKNLYQEMAESNIVVGWSSTCLAELYAFGRPPVIIKNSISEGNFPHDIGIWIERPEDLATLQEIKTDEKEKSKYWSTNFEDTAKNHLEMLLNIQ